MNNSKFAARIREKSFVITAEFQPTLDINASAITALAVSLGGPITAVNVGANHYGVALSSLAAALTLAKAGVETVFQVTTRDRNRIALQSDLLGAAHLGIKNVLCLSGYHQALLNCPESAHVYDIDSIQLVAALKKLEKERTLLDGNPVKGDFAMLVGAVANPYLVPLELNIMRLTKKVAAGADFIQTQAIFDTDKFAAWLAAAAKERLTEKTAILAGVLPLESAAEARALNEKYTDFSIPESVIARLEKAGNPDAQKKEGLAICAEIIKKIKPLKGLRGIHILSGGKEAVVPQVLAAAGLQ